MGGCIPGNRPPLDRPSDSRPHRIYVAVTNHCNRACPWCSTYSSPSGNTWLSMGRFKALLAAHEAFEVQLEGGEPTLHPDFWSFVETSWSNGSCQRLVLCTNGVALPREHTGLIAFLERLGAPTTIKLSVNHYLLDHDPGLLAMAERIRAFSEASSGALSLVVNVRLRKGYDADDSRVLNAVREAGLLDCSNVFFLQKYGKASGEEEWEEPFLQGTRFSLVNPDGRTFGTDLVGRSEAMGKLP